MQNLSLAAITIIAKSDQRLFNQILLDEGLTIIGTVNDQPLDKTIMAEEISSIASTITNDIDDQVEMTKRQAKLKDLAENFGYIVAVQEGLDQHSGTDYNPIKGQLHHPDYDEEEESEEGEGDESPPKPPA